MDEAMEEEDRLILDCDIENNVSSYHLLNHLSLYLPEVRNQDGDTCIANSASALIEFKKRMKFSPLYSACTSHMCDFWGGPLVEEEITRFLEWLRDSGTADDDDIYQGLVDPSANKIGYPNSHRISGFRWIHHMVSQNIWEIKGLTHQSQGNLISDELLYGPVVIGVRSCRKLSFLGKDDVYIWEPDYEENGERMPVTLHAMCVIGFGYCSKGLFFYVLNSWGREWCDKGIGKVLWSEVVSCWTIDV